ncbi:MAG TPA: DUF5996 family protein [Candidatus Dormibacteraeota bacterium]|nr:DUF5996 family protein [Candidatus Dormibacteraeota bacterium]
MTDEWPELPYERWRPTLDTLHLYAQLVGKLRLALSPFEPQWANVPLYVTARGLTTSPIPLGGRTFDAEFDFFAHALVVRVSDGGTTQIPLGGAVADFYAAVMEALRGLRLPVAISEVPSEIPDPIPFPEDRTHATYEHDQAHRFWRALARVDTAMKRHRATFLGRTSPVQFFWGSFDLANTRYSGRPATPPPGADRIMRYSEDAEQVCAGFWPGSGGTPYAAFFAYGYPRPDGVERAAVRPAPARWDEAGGLFLLAYDAVRTSSDPEGAIMEFLSSTYDACAAGLGWSPDLVSGPRSGS